MDLIRSQLIKGLPDYLGRQRWFADKHRRIASVKLPEAMAVDTGESIILLVLVEVQFDEGEASSYFMPLILRPKGPHQTFSVCTFDYFGIGYEVVDAIAEAPFHRWLLQSIWDNRDLEIEHGHIECRLESEMSHPIAGLSGRLAGVEQSNSSILFGDSIIAKVYRRLTVGTNPDLEIGRFLTWHTNFKDTPALLGSAQFLDAHGPTTLVLVQEQLRTPVDCWTALLDALKREDWHSADIGEPLGAVTAELHLALASGSHLPDFAAEIATGEVIASWKSAFGASVDRVVHQLVARQDQLDSSTRGIVEAFLAVSTRLNQRSAGFDTLLGLPLIRIHGDYHLGQVLRLPDGRLSIVDFEGEPQRPIQERRMKTSPLKDVAGMLRSFSYARGSAAAAADESSYQSLLTWEAEQRERFISEYRRVIADSEQRLLPERQDDLDTAITAWEIDKALYEVLYELSSRPGWLWLPLSSLVEIG